jgi:hypothetical protein
MFSPFELHSGKANTGQADSRCIESPISSDANNLAASQLGLCTAVTGRRLPVCPTTKAEHGIKRTDGSHSLELPNEFGE